MTDKLVQAWFSNRKWVWCLFPLSAIFWLLSCLRRWFFRVGLLSSQGAAIPVIVVGNIGIGGNGKTPLVLALVDTLQAKGYTPAVLSRGYGGSQTHFPHMVDKNDDASVVGDEPALISKRKQCIVVIDPIRTRAVQYIEQHTTANVIICDDGLQHYAMKRDLEICVLDKRGIGNGYLLPMGPLREGVWRLNTVDCVVRNIGFSDHEYPNGPTIDNPSFEMRLQPTNWVNVNTQEIKSLADFAKCIKQVSQHSNITALAGIGDPKRFFDTLVSMQIPHNTALAFEDHHTFTASDLPEHDWILMTEKDAVKCAKFCHSNAWYLRIDAGVSEDFFLLVERIINEKLRALSESKATKTV